MLRLQYSKQTTTATMKSAADTQPDPTPLINADILRALPPRPRDSHKGSFGSVGILGGAPGMSGAALLAARAALLLGAGRVYAGLLAGGIAVDGLQPEIMLPTPDQLLDTALDVLAAGPGLGQSEAAVRLLEQALATPACLVLDADALNLVAAHSGLKQAVLARTAPTLLTPHPGEAARLLDCDAATIQRERTVAALRLASEYRAFVVLKGTGSVCATGDGQCRINPSGNPGLASAGMGDVLTGMLAALLAQGMAPFDALQLATYLHGAAADALVARGVGPVGLSASEVTLAARALLNRRAEGRFSRPQP